MTTTGYFFARELRKKLGDVPIGLVECAWGGTRIQPWISKKNYLSDPEMKAYYETEVARLKTWDATEAHQEFKVTFQQWQAKGIKYGRPKPQVDPAKDKQWPTTLHNGMLASIQPYAIKGAIWYQG